MIVKITPATFFIQVAMSSFAVLAAVNSHASVQAITISSDESIPSPRWIFGEGAPPKGNSVEAQLAAVKDSQLQGHHKACVEKAQAVRPRAKSLQAWISVVELDCAKKLSMSRANADLLSQALATVEKNQEWLFVGPQAEALRTEVLAGYQLLTEQDIKTNRTRAWKSIERLQQLTSYMDVSGRAKLWEMAGELSFLQQKTEAAREFIHRSLNEKESSALRARLQTIESILAAVRPGKDNQTSAQKGSQVAGRDSVRSSSLEASQEELDLVERITVALKSGDLLPAVKDSIELIQKYPGGTRAQWAADRALESYTNLIGKTDRQYTHLREQMLSQLLKADEQRLAEWARFMYNRGQYTDSLKLASESLENATGARRTRTLELVADAALATDDHSTARDALDELVVKHAGTPASREALFRSGLLNYRLKKYQLAVADFERFLLLPDIQKHEVTARHWLWRALQKTGSERANQVADELIERFPFTYYGLRAALERNDNKLEWTFDKKVKVESRVWLTGHERLAYEKMRLLLKSGWLDEAQAELRQLPPPQKAEDKAIRALFWAAAAQYVRAAQLANEAWDEKSELRGAPFVQSTLPREFVSQIEKHATAKKVDLYLVRSLIKQESGYNARAVSPANALGLMQLMAPTAKEVAAQLKLENLRLPDDLFIAERNIQIGTHYLSRMIDRFQGHVPLALAAYNAGPTRLDRWLRSRESLKNLRMIKSSSADDELWFDEIPYLETSIYVKSILRNILLYKALDNGRVEFSDPVWASKSRM